MRLCHKLHIRSAPFQLCLALSARSSLPSLSCACRCRAVGLALRKGTQHTATLSITKPSNARSLFNSSAVLNAVFSFGSAGAHIRMPRGRYARRTKQIGMPRSVIIHCNIVVKICEVASLDEYLGSAEALHHVYNTLWAKKDHSWALLMSRPSNIVRSTKNWSAMQAWPRSQKRVLAQVGSRIKIWILPFRTLMKTGAQNLAQTTMRFNSWAATGIFSTRCSFLNVRKWQTVVSSLKGSRLLLNNFLFCDSDCSLWLKLWFQTFAHLFGAQSYWLLPFTIFWKCTATLWVDKIDHFPIFVQEYRWGFY